MDHDHQRFAPPWLQRGRRKSATGPGTPSPEARPGNTPDDAAAPGAIAGSRYSYAVTPAPSLPGAPVTTPGPGTTDEPRQQRRKGLRRGIVIGFALGSAATIAVGFVLGTIRNERANEDDDAYQPYAPLPVSVILPTTVPDWAGEADGTAEHPYPFGSTVENAQWRVTVNNPSDITDTMEATDDDQGGPGVARRFYGIPLTMTNVDDEHGRVYLVIDIEFVGTDQHHYREDCRFFRGDVYGANDLSKGGSTNVMDCAVVPPDEPGLWAVDLGNTFEPLYFSAGPGPMAPSAIG